MVTREAWARFARRSAGDWRHGVGTLAALARGAYYALYFRLFRRDVVIELPFLAYERVSIIGPGSVRIAPSCSVHPNVFRGLSVVTLSPAAVVRIGPRCSLGGLDIRCHQRVVIGQKTMTAHSLIQDVILFSDPERRTDAGLPRGAVEVGRNAWLGGLTCLLGPTTVGDDSVLSWGATCLNVIVPPASLASGSPVTRTVPIDRVQLLERSARDSGATRLPV